MGLEVLAADGADALTLERVTAAAGKTRGSFYHHFEEYEVFLTALGATWLQLYTDDVIAEAESARGKRRETLARRAVRIDQKLERELRRLAAREPTIAAAVHVSDEKRIAYVARLFRSELGLAASEALARARIEHCAFVGAQMVFPDADQRFRLRLEATLGRTLWRK